MCEEVVDVNGAVATECEHRLEEDVRPRRRNLPLVEISRGPPAEATATWRKIETLLYLRLCYSVSSSSRA